jgi:hypothetical protein
VIDPTRNNHEHDSRLLRGFSFILCQVHDHVFNGLNVAQRSTTLIYGCQVIGARTSYVVNFPDDEPNTTVIVLAIGVKERDRVRIGGEIIEL